MVDSQEATGLACSQHEPLRGPVASGGEGDSGQHTPCSRGHWLSVPPQGTKREQRPECLSCSQPRFGWGRGPDQLRSKQLASNAELPERD